MSAVNEIIVLDDDEEEEEPPRPTKAKATLRNTPKQTNGKAEESSGSNQKSKAEAISAENKALFNEFVEFCSKLTTEHPEVIEFLQGRYAKASPSYLTSVEFRNTVGRCLTRVQAKRSKIFVYINELCTALKANSQKRKVNLQTQAVQQPTAASTATTTETVTENDAEAEEAPVKKSGSKRQIRYLENLLRIYSLEIKKLQERELTLDELEDEDSSYIQESRLKRKLLRIFEKLCELKDCNSLTGRVIEQRILYRGTRYPEINRRLEKFINGSRDLFPDYGDVLRVVERANDKHRLGLSRKQMQSMAQDAFRELGNKLQDRRHLDMIYNFGCHLTDPYKSVNDPAVQDTSLARRLRDNRNMAMNRLDDIIKKYAELQDDGDDHRMQTRRGPEKSRVSSSEASEEEEEESEDSETDIEEELEQSNEAPESEENEEDVPADPDNEADQKMDMASGAEDGGKGKKDDDDDENVIEEQEEATEQESSPASTSASSSHDKDSPNTTLDDEAEGRLSGSPDPPLSNESSAKAKSDEEHNEEPEACETPENTAEPMEEEEEQEQEDSAPNSVDTGSKEIEEAEDVVSNCNSPSATQGSAKHKNPQKYLLPDMTVSIEKDKESEDGEDVTGPVDDRSCEGDVSERSVSPGVQEESDAINMEESSAKRTSIDSEPGSMEGSPNCTDEAKSDEEPDQDSAEDRDDPVEEGDDPVEDGDDPVEEGDDPVEDGDNPVEDGDDPVEDGDDPVEDGDDPVEDGDDPVEDSDDQVKDCDDPVKDGDDPVEDGDDPFEDCDDPVEDSAASADHSPPKSPAMKREKPTTNVHTETTDLDTNDKKDDCALSPRGSSNGVHAAAQVRSPFLNRLKLNKDKATPRDSPKQRTPEQASPPPNRKRKAMSPKKWTHNNGLTRYNGKEYTEDHNKKDHKRAKMDCSYTSLSSSSDSDSDSIVEDERTPGLMMTCSPRETPKKSTKKTHVSTQCDPDEVIVLSD